MTRKFTIHFVPEQVRMMDMLKKFFRAKTWADVFRRLLALGLLVADVHAKNQRLAILDVDGTVVEHIRILR